MNDIKVSVIVPIYNAEQYLKRCINSIINQTYKNIEIILIDDGSEDNSFKICNEFAKKDGRINLICQRNSGVSVARNNGLNVCNGDYILFVDSDDYLELDCLETCLKIINMYDLDILKFGFVKELNLYKKKNKFNVLVNECIFKEEYNEKIYSYVLKTPDCCNIWNAIIKKDICTHKRFNKNLTMGEDYLFFINCLVDSKKIYFLDKSFYHYIINDESITHNFDFEKNIKKLENSLYVNKKVQDILNFNGYYQKNDYIIQDSKNILGNLEICIMNQNYKNYCSYINSIKNNTLLNKKIVFLYDKLSRKTRLLLNKSRFYFILIKIKSNLKLIIKKIFLIIN